MNKITTHSVYILLQHVPWFHEHANALWNLHKTQSWWENRLTSLWSFGLPLKQRVALWRGSFGVFPNGLNLQKKKITLLHCGGKLETTFIQRVCTLHLLKIA